MRIPELWRMSGRAGRLPVAPDPAEHSDHRLHDTPRDRILAVVSPLAFLALVAGWGAAAGWWG